MAVRSTLAQNTNASCPEQSWQQSTIRDEDMKAARQQHTNLHTYYSGDQDFEILIKLNSDLF